MSNPLKDALFDWKTQGCPGRCPALKDPLFFHFDLSKLRSSTSLPSQKHINQMRNHVFCIEDSPPSTFASPESTVASPPQPAYRSAVAFWSSLRHSSRPSVTSAAKERPFTCGFCRTAEAKEHRFKFKRKRTISCFELLIAMASNLMAKRKRTISCFEWLVPCARTME